MYSSVQLCKKCDKKRQGKKVLIWIESAFLVSPLPLNDKDGLQVKLSHRGN